MSNRKLFIARLGVPGRGPMGAVRAGFAVLTWFGVRLFGRRGWLIWTAQGTDVIYFRWSHSRGAGSRIKSGMTGSGDVSADGGSGF